MYGKSIHFTHLFLNTQVHNILHQTTCRVSLYEQYISKLGKMCALLHSINTKHFVENSTFNTLPAAHRSF